MSFKSHYEKLFARYNTDKKQNKTKLMYLHNILFTVQSVLEVLALCLCFHLLNFTSTQLSSIPKSCWGSVTSWLCARLVKRLLIRLAISKLCNLKSSFLYYFKIHLIVSCKNYMLKKSQRLSLYHFPNCDQQGMDPATYGPGFFPQLLTQLSPQQEMVFCIKAPSGSFYHFNSCKTYYQQCCVAKKFQSLITTGKFYYSELSRC